MTGGAADVAQQHRAGSLDGAARRHPHVHRQRPDRARHRRAIHQSPGLRAGGLLRRLRDRGGRRAHRARRASTTRRWAPASRGPTPPAQPSPRSIALLGGCAGAAAGDFQYIGSSAGTTFTDARAQGGFTYGYKVRGADGCGEGPPSSLRRDHAQRASATWCRTSPGSARATSGLPRRHRAAASGWPGPRVASSCPAGPTGDATTSIARRRPTSRPTAGNLLTSITSVPSTTTTIRAWLPTPPTTTWRAPRTRHHRRRPSRTAATRSRTTVYALRHPPRPARSPRHLQRRRRRRARLRLPPAAVADHQRPGSSTGTFSYHPGFDGLTRPTPPASAPPSTSPSLSIAARRRFSRIG